ncbi:unnamed protein product [Sympodiomycopsis kandeliae]
MDLPPPSRQSSADLQWHWTKAVGNCPQSGWTKMVLNDGNVWTKAGRKMKRRTYLVRQPKQFVSRHSSWIAWNRNQNAELRQ